MKYNNIYIPPSSRPFTRKIRLYCSGKWRDLLRFDCWKIPRLHFVSLGMTMSIIIIFVSFTISPANAQYVQYPVRELGNCQNARECYLYCQIPEHTPACWSYNTYILNENVLGETTTTPTLTYPIAQLGNCANAEACFIYCNQPQNQNACFSYARSKGLVKEETHQDDGISQEVITAAKTELGCDSRESCGAICTNAENHDKCFAFAKKHGLHKDSSQNEGQRPTPPPDIMEKAQTELGCSTQDSCMRMCQNPNNTEKCIEFGKKHNLMGEEEVKRFEAEKEKFQEYAQKKEEMMQEAKTELGCDSYTSCSSFCSKEENREKCMNLAKKHNIITSPSNVSMQQHPSPPINCTGDAKCVDYCREHPSECRGFTNQNSTGSSHEEEENSKTAQGTPIPQRMLKESGIQSSEPIKSKPIPSGPVKEGTFLGPKGCKTEKECRAYCEKHASECPGFPQPPPTTQSTQPRPSEFKPIESKPTEYKPPEHSSTEEKSLPPPYPSPYNKSGGTSDNNGTFSSPAQF